MTLGKYSIGIGDRFGRQGEAQLQALQRLKVQGVTVTPVWNKSYREHSIINSQPADTRAEADAAVAALGWQEPYFVDADHVGMKTVDHFLAASDFFTIDVADFIGQVAEQSALDAFVARCQPFTGTLQIPLIPEPFSVTRDQIAGIGANYLFAIEEAQRIYRHIAAGKHDQPFVVEISMDETNLPQSPVELFFILAAVAWKEIPVTTIAPKFTGRFNKGVDYVGDPAQFTREFEEDLAVIAFARDRFGLPSGLKLSVHSGSDKFALYGPINAALKKYNAGLHLKTAGTTWLEEVIGLAEAGGEGLAMAKAIYRHARARFEELCKPYATVIDIDPARLPAPDEVDGWEADQFAAVLRHNQSQPLYNPHFRQLIHVGYKVAAEMGERYLQALERFRPVIAKNVTENILERHLLRIFL
ncbi:MAG TPA: tagaturonate epimerase family protein [bacterium]|nr:tagaturonate epimerase family protein [bacterium]HQI47180.1 tagaturonate epimerase family protein [bacterium]HQJ63521.1 tagaturonate epimerase family protein [bacterium]